MTPRGKANHIPHTDHPSFLFGAGQCRVVQSRFRRNVNRRGDAQTKVAVSFENISQVEHCAPRETQEHPSRICTRPIQFASLNPDSARRSPAIAAARAAVSTQRRRLASVSARSRTSSSISPFLCSVVGAFGCTEPYGRMNFRGGKPSEHLIGRTNNCSVRALLMSRVRCGLPKLRRTSRLRQAAASGRPNSISLASANGLAMRSLQLFPKFSSVTRCGMFAS